MIRTIIVWLVGALVATGALATTAPRDGGPLPKAYFEAKAKDRSAFTMTRAWIQKTRRIKEAREAYLQRLVAEHPAALAAPLPQELAVTGTLNVPVVAGYFLNEASQPYPASTLQNVLWDNNPTGTVSQYYAEVSYGLFGMDGTVYGWTHVSQNDAYYEGTQNGLGPDSHVGDFIKELLDAHDGAVDFGQYDNDGPDGIPNSGDDDGFVDVLCVVHSERGGECGGNANIWSHRWVYIGWPISGGLPYQTNDLAAGGGFVKVNDYVMQPGRNCGNAVIEIGVFCHELGHSFGLPDLYDTNGGGQGIGHWGIMGSGNWNTPTRPAHPEAWTRKELGWLSPTSVDWMVGSESIPNINENAVAYRLPFTDDRFRRSSACAISGSSSLYCGLAQAQGTARGWASPGPTGGYGPNWYQTVERDFRYSGTGTVTFQYKYDYDLEPNYDYAFSLIEVNGAEAVLATYTGTNGVPGTANINITPYLIPLTGAGGTYTLKFRVITDPSFDDADGHDGSTCGALAVDDVAVTGGGEGYSTGFETYVDGWHPNPAENPVSEYWLVENRRRIGFDQNLHGEGLLIWHVDDEVMHSPTLANDGGPNQIGVRGLVLEEAEGVFDLNGAGANRGEEVDVFPGPLNKTSFTGATAPNSNDNTGRPTQIEVTAVSPAASTMTATMKAGDPAPQAAGVSPNAIDNNQVAVLVTTSGGLIRHGATFRFTYSPGAAAPGEIQDSNDIVATSLEWVDPTVLRGTVNVYSKTGGTWDLVVTNPDGQSVTLPDALTINQLVATQLVSASIDLVAEGVRLRYELRGREEGETILLYRSARAETGWTVIVEDLQPEAGERYVHVDADVVPGKTYYYLLESRLPSGETRELHRGSALVSARELVLDQNRPNPFNPQTTIRFYLPERGDVVLDVFDVRGALVRRLARGVYDAGPHEVTWDGTGSGGQRAASGVYVYRLTTAQRTLNRKMVLLK